MSTLEIIDISKEHNIIIKDNEQKKFIIFNGDKTLENFKLNIEVSNNTSLEILNVVTTSNNTLLNEVINVNGAGALVNITNVLLVKNASLESDIIINHNMGNSESNFANYCIALQNSNVVLNNNAFIKNGCHGSVVHQKAKGLSLDKSAKITAQPNLFIDEYDVVASHAASIGSINKEDLFYLTSRGLTTEEASKLIVLGFIQPVLDKIEDESLKKDIYNHFIELF